MLTLCPRACPRAGFGRSAAALRKRRIIRGMEISAEQQRRIDSLCQRYQVRGLRLFGSAATGCERADSDVDLLLDFEPAQAPSAFERVDLRDALSQVFGGRPVDLAFAGILDNPYRRRSIEPQLRALYMSGQA